MLTLSVQFARNRVLCPWELGVVHCPVWPGEQVAADGHGHVSGDAEEAADESGGGEVGG